jgi:hypothetical protein
VAFCAPPPSPVARLILASHLGVLATQLGISPRVKAPNPDATRGEGDGLGSLLAGFSQTQGISFLSHSL